MCAGRVQGVAVCLGLVAELLDEFLNDWLAANPRELPVRTQP